MAVVETTTSRSESFIGRVSSIGRVPSIGRAPMVGRALIASGRRQVLARVLSAFLACGLVQCDRCDSAPAPAPTASVVAPQPPVAPEGLLAEFVVPRPDSLWGAIRELAAGYAPALPHEGALGLVHGLGLPLAAAGLFELKLPLLGVLTRDASGQVVATAAIPVTSGRELVALLTTGAAPPFVAKAGSSGVTLLAPNAQLTAKAPGSSYHLAVFRNHLIVSSAREQALGSARFLVEVASQRSLPDATLAVTAREAQLKGPLLELLRARWRAYQAELRASEEQARRDRGRPPDFADPEAVLTALNSGVEAVLGALASTHELTLRARVVAGDLELSFQAPPSATGPVRNLVSGLTTGSAEPLRGLTSDTVLAVLSRSSNVDRVVAARDAGVWLERAFGARLPEKERVQMTELFEHFARGRGEEMTVSLVLGSAPAVLVQGTLGDPAEFETALNGLPALLEVKAIAEPLTHFLGPVRSTPVRATIAGRAVRGHAFSFAPKGPLHELVPAGLSVFWSAADGRYRLAVGGSQARAHFEPPATPRSLAEVPGAGLLFERIESASFVLLARPVPLGLLPEHPRSQQEPLISISAGSRGGIGFLDTYIPGEVIRHYALASAEPGQP